MAGFFVPAFESACDRLQLHSLLGYKSVEVPLRGFRLRGWLFTSTYGGGRTAFEGGNLLESAFVELVCPPKVKMLVKILVKILGAAEKSKKSENFGGLLEACSDIWDIKAR